MNLPQWYFKYFHVHVTGIVTGTSKKNAASADPRLALEALVDSKYRSTIHIDSTAVLRTFKGSRAFDEFSLSGSPGSWAPDVAEVFEKMKKNDAQDSGCTNRHGS